MEWLIHEEDLKGIRAAGEACQYWLCETAKLRKQGPERNQPMALFVKPNGQSRFVFHSCHEHLRKAAQAAEALDVTKNATKAGGGRL
jgi:hypothetical protein